MNSGNLRRLQQTKIMFHKSKELMKAYVEFLRESAKQILNKAGRFKTILNVKLFSKNLIRRKQLQVQKNRILKKKAGIVQKTEF